MNSPIEIVLAVYDAKGTYSVHAGVVMTSIFEHTTSPVRVHILHDSTLTDDNRQKFLRTAEKYGQCVEFHDLTELVKNLGPDVLALINGVAAVYSIGTLFRLLIEEALDVDRVIYLDCDVLVNLDIRELWEIDLKGNCIGGVWHALWPSHNSREKVRLALMKCKRSEYIYAGVLLMDLKKIRELPVSIIDATPAWFARHGHLAYCTDQDFLNAFFRGSILQVDGKFLKWVPSHSGKDVIAHQKFWVALDDTPQKKCYWHTFLKSAWGENVTPDEIVDILAEATVDPASHRGKPALWRRLKIDRIDTLAITKYLLLEARYWLMRPFRKNKP